MRPRKSAKEKAAELTKAQLAEIAIERNLLGALFRTSQIYWEIEDTLKAEDFLKSLHRDIYTAIGEVLSTKQALSFAALLARLPAEDDEGDDVAAYVTTIVANAEGLEVDEFAPLVVEAGVKRRANQAIEKAKAHMRAEDRTMVDVLNDLEEAIIQIKRAAVPERPKAIHSLAARAIDASAAAYQGQDTYSYDTGLPSIDEILGKIMPGDLGVILASQGDGKTALAAQMLRRNARAGRPSLFFQLEMTGEGIATRELTQATDLSVRQIREGAYTFGEFEQLKAAQRALVSVPLFVHDSPRMTMSQVRNQCIAMKRTHGLGMVGLDHLRLIKASPGFRGDRFERMGEAMFDARVLAKELGVPFVMLVQRTRRGQRREDDPTPQIDDADSPSIEQDADWILGLWRMENWLRRNKPAEKEGVEAMENWKLRLRNSYSLGHVIGLKVRSGRSGQERTLGWVGSKTRFTEQTDPSTRKASLPAETALEDYVPL